MNSFTPLDYAIFGAYLLATVSLGLFFVRRGKRAEQTAEAQSGASSGIGEFLLAGRGMGSIIVAVSVVAALFSGITYLGSAAEVYVHDLSFLLIALSFFIATPVTTLLFLPFFYHSRFFTAYQFLGERFALPVRTLASGLFILRVLLWLALATYAPALSLQQVTGLPLWIMILLTGALTTFYTALGGMKAVIWTDVAQFCVLIGGQFVIVAVALNHIPGGIGGAYDIGKAGGKFVLNLSLDPTARVTLWGLIIGGAFTNLVQLATDQVSVQRYLTASSIGAARRALWIKLFLTIPVVALFYGTGVLLYAFYHAPGGPPDPLTSGAIGKADQILPYFVVSQLPAGLPALLVAAIFSASMSVVSAGLHALSTTTLVDILHPLRQRGAAGSAGSDAAPVPSAQPESELRLIKGLIVGYGVLVVALAFLVSRVGTLVEASNALMGLIGGPVLGLFLLGMVSRRANTKGALVGWLAGFAALIGVVFFTKVSFLWYAFTGCAVTFVCGEIASAFYKSSEKAACSFRRVWRSAGYKRDMNRVPPPVFPSTDPEARNYKSDTFELGTLTNIVLLHDPLCPWCWVGYFHAKKLTEEFGVTFDWRGAELIPPSMEYTPRPPQPADAPPEPPKPPSRFDLFAEAEGIAMPTPRPPFVRTHHALLGAEWAWSQGMDAFDAYNDAIYRGYWEHSADIADLTVLGDLTKAAGLDADALRASIESGEYENNIIPFDDDAYALGVRHVPTFLFNAEEKLAEAPYADLARATERFLIRSERFRAKTG